MDAIRIDDVKGRIGLILPSSNTVMEPEFYRSIPPGIAVYTTRVPLPGPVESELIRMEKKSEEAAGLIRDCSPDLIIYGCTSGSFVKGKEFDRQIAKKIQRVSGIHAITASQAVSECLNKRNVKNITLVTPYTRQINKKEMDYLEKSGFRVVSSTGLGITKGLEIGKVPLSKTYDLCKKPIWKNPTGFS